MAAVGVAVAVVVAEVVFAAVAVADNKLPLNRCHTLPRPPSFLLAPDLV